MSNPTPAPGLRLLDDRVAIRKQALERVSRGGIILGNAEEDTGVVVAVGPGKPRKDGGRAPMWVEPGDEVFFSPKGNARVKVNGDELVVVGIQSVIGVIEP